ncbi:MAG: hypothetical protein LBQ48_02565 [Oscillospiraceae bacterium]|jgi:hypothetical protein|nr:hypothetical protein [Oscillospiraceae bacterium]
MAELDREKIGEAIHDLSGQLGSDGDKLKSAFDSGSLDKILKNLKPQDAQKLQGVLQNKEETERLLKSPQAQALMKYFMKK